MKKKIHLKPDFSIKISENMISKIDFLVLIWENTIKSYEYFIEIDQIWAVK